MTTGRTAFKARGKKIIKKRERRLLCLSEHARLDSCEREREREVEIERDREGEREREGGRERER